MWTDEVQTLLVSASGEFRWGPTYRTAPLNFYLTGAAVRVLGASELGARIVPFLMGLLTVALMYLLFRQWIGTRASLFAMLTLAGSMWHVFWSQTARHYSLLLLLVLLGLYAFLWFWRRDRQVGLWVAMLAFFAALFTHTSAGFVVVALLAFVIASWLYQRLASGQSSASLNRKHLLASIALSIPLAVYLPVYVIVGRYLMTAVVAWNPPWNIVGSLAFYVPPYLAMAALAGAAFLLRERDSMWFLLMCMVVVPMVLVIIASTLTIASAVYALSSLLAVAILVGVACDRLLKVGSSSGLLVPVGLAISGIFLQQIYDLAHYHTFYNGLKPRWREVSMLVGERRREGDVFLAEEADVARFYLGRDEADWFGSYEEPIANGEFPTAELTGVWYAFYVGDPILRVGPGTLARIRANADLVALFPLHYGAKDRTIAVYYQSMSDGIRRRRSPP